MIAREGFVFIFSGAALTILMILAAARWDSVWLFAVSLVFAVLTIFVTFFFRDPHRVTVFSRSNRAFW
jgi:phosphotransferase system  glucose/maltose/N-acetylglucosamine-specific IIC component